MAMDRTPDRYSATNETAQEDHHKNGTMISKKIRVLTGIKKLRTGWCGKIRKKPISYEYKTTEEE